MIAIDPGPVESAYMVFEDGHPRIWAKEPNLLIVDKLRLGYARLGGEAHFPHTMVIEMISSYGMAVGQEVFNTCVWIGRFMEAFGANRTETILRATVKAAVCRTAKANDSNIRMALMDRYGGKAAIKKGGALYKLHGDCWSALAVAVAYTEIHALWSSNPETITSEDPISPGRAGGPEQTTPVGPRRPARLL